ncbi:MAG: dihydrofolate reductase [Bdellovibrionales bacterium]
MSDPKKNDIIISHIAACSQNRVIGSDNKLPWNIPEDWKFFKEKTTGHCLVMGRKTFESLGKALPNRLNVVITRDKNFQAPDTVIFPSIELAIEFCKTQTEKYGNEIFIGGGGEIYKQTLPIADRVYLTVIHKDFKGDAFYPELPMDEFQEVERRERQEPIPFTFFTYDRIKKNP